CAEQSGLLPDDCFGGLIGHETGDGEREQREDFSVQDDALAAAGICHSAGGDEHVAVGGADDGEGGGVVADGARERPSAEAKTLDEAEADAAGMVRALCGGRGWGTARA